MLDQVLGHERPPEDLYAFLRLQLSELEMDYVDAIEAIRQYRDVEISSLDELGDRVRPHIIWSHDGPSGFLLRHIPPRWMPTMTNDHLRNAVRQIASPELKLEWLRFVKEMLKPEGETGAPLQGEIMSLK